MFKRTRVSFEVLHRAWETYWLNNSSERENIKKKKFGAHEEMNIKHKAPIEAYGEQEALVEAYNEQ